MASSMIDKPINKEPDSKQKGMMYTTYDTEQSSLCDSCGQQRIISLILVFIIISLLNLFLLILICYNILGGHESQSPLPIPPTFSLSQSPLNTSSSQTNSQVYPLSDGPVYPPANSPVTPVYTYTYYVGDYKISAQHASHDNWLLCDGSFLDPRNYSELFNVIGYSFGNQTSTDEYVQSGPTYQLLIRFALPNPYNRVLAINGKHIGHSFGGSVSLRIENIPSHSHIIDGKKCVQGVNKETSGALPCYHINVHQSTHDGCHVGSFGTCWNNYYPDNVYNINPGGKVTSNVGDGKSFEVNQP